MANPEREVIRKKKELTELLVRMGYPEMFGQAIGNQLGSPKTLERMIRYLNQACPKSAEEIVDEMLAICDERAQWQKKKATEFYTQRYNQMLREGLDPDERSN